MSLVDVWGDGDAKPAPLDGARGDLDALALGGAGGSEHDNVRTRLERTGSRKHHWDDDTQITEIPSVTERINRGRRDRTTGAARREVRRATGSESAFLCAD